MKKIINFLKRIFRYGFETPEPRCSHNNVITRILIMDAKGNRDILEIDPYKHGVAQIVGVNQNLYKIKVDNKDLLSFKPLEAGKVAKGVINKGTERTIKVKEFNYLNHDLRSRFIAGH